MKFLSLLKRSVNTNWEISSLTLFHFFPWDLRTRNSNFHSLHAKVFSAEVIRFHYFFPIALSSFWQLVTAIPKPDPVPKTTGHALRLNRTSERTAPTVKPAAIFKPPSTRHLSHFWKGNQRKELKPCLVFSFVVLESVLRHQPGNANCLSNNFSADWVKQKII